MSAVYCGSKRSHLEDTPSPPSKRFRFSNSPTSFLDQLRTAFPHLPQTILVKSLEEHGSDLDAAMKSLYSLVSADDWVELLVKEVTQSTNKDDAKLRAMGVMDALEKMLTARAREEAANKFLEEKLAMQEQIEALMKDNTVLKRAVAIQHERQKGFDEEKQQLEVLKQMVPQYQEKLRTLEVNNYGLRMQLREREHRSSMLGRFNPDVF